MLDREMRFYERMEPIFAELVPLVHDLLYYMQRDEEIEREKECEAFRENFGRYIELIKELKNETTYTSIICSPKCICGSYCFSEENAR